MDLVSFHRKANDWSRQVVERIHHDAWGRDTPCTDWSVRDVVNHVAAENLWVSHILAGETMEDVGDRYEGDVLGDRPVQRFEESARSAQQAVEEDGALERIVHLSFGDVPGEVYVLQRGTDLLVHTWDIAVATGQPADIDEELAGLAYERNAPMITDEVREMGIFGPEVPVDENAPAGHRLLGVLGRDPGWMPPAG